MDNGLLVCCANVARLSDVLHVELARMVDEAHKSNSLTLSLAVSLVTERFLAAFKAHSLLSAKVIHQYNIEDSEQTPGEGSGEESGQQATEGETILPIRPA